MRCPSATKPTDLPLVVRAVRLALADGRDSVRWIPDRAARGGMDAASRAGGGVRQARRRGNERDHTCVATKDTQRAAVFSLQLRRAHQQLREELARIREALGRDEHVVTGLQVHCLAFCSALATHHRDEDDGGAGHNR
jgi:hypothetical protein